MELELIRRALHELSEADSLDDLRAVLGRLFSGLGIAQYAFVRVDSAVLGASPLLVSNHHACWQQLYRSRYQCIDPFLHHARCSALPFLWRDVSVRASCCAADAAFLACARRHGIDVCRGASIPVHVRGEQLALLSFGQAVGGGHGRDIYIRDALLLSGVATTLHLRVGQLMAGCRPRSLTRRERECLLWASRGKAQEEIAVILGLRPRTVRFHQENAMWKLGARNIAAAVAIATALGLV
ncbi:helix-turn-helix transcriptional regulator [Stutzerimonas nitrititolerans]|uniref:helix-turn-helix transcriptional regulator n=1 Tax=Stutzerimonas nitrititolerans TaxID=2482751 RepID=UPI0028A7F859|nr:autoinducer binding domain-containing protein [Stutzerimonas nitrititolerans]